MKTAISNSNLRSLRGSHLVVFMAATVFVLLGVAMAPAQTASSSDHAVRPVVLSQRQAAAVAALQTEKTESEAKPDDASHQGIKVHGHWKIVVKNPDGSLDSTHEFENSLQDGGVLISYLLAGQASAGEAAIFLSNKTACLSNGPMCSIITGSSTGYWAASDFCTGSSPAGVCYPGLNTHVDLQTFYTSDDIAFYKASLILSGSFVATYSDTIINVGTFFTGCSGPSGRTTVTPAQCYANQMAAGTTVGELPPGAYPDPYLGPGLTGTSLNPPIEFLSGQTVQVTVTLSFS